jgi:hypothetical protein
VLALSLLPAAALAKGGGHGHGNGHWGGGNDGACRDYNPLRNPYFGDTHVHTSRSLDARLQGEFATQADAYVYAKGGPLEMKEGLESPIYIEKPLDFTAVTDHAEYFGEWDICNDRGGPGVLPPNPAYLAPACVGLRAPPGSTLNNVAFAIVFATSWLPEARVRRVGFCTDCEVLDFWGVFDANGITEWPCPTEEDPDAMCSECPAGDDELGQDAFADFADENGLDACFSESLSTWQEAVGAADDANDPCKFTALPAYEWTGGALSANLHRNVIFRGSLDGESSLGVVPTRPYSLYEAPYREDLWDLLNGDGCDSGDPEADCQVLIITHNANLSQGRMYEVTDRKRRKGFLPPYTYETMDTEYGLKFVNYERLTEVVQHKGQSECLSNDYPTLVPTGQDVSRASDDEFCNFEIVPWATLAGTFFNGGPKPQDFVRDAYKVGLQMAVTRPWSTNAMGELVCLDENGEKVDPPDCGPAFNIHKMGIVGSTDTHRGAPGYTAEAPFVDRAGNLRAWQGHGGGGALFASGNTLPLCDEALEPEGCVCACGTPCDPAEGGPAAECIVPCSGLNTDVCDANLEPEGCACVCGSDCEGQLPEGEACVPSEDVLDPPGCTDISAPEPDFPTTLADQAEYGPGGLAVVWAEENTREAIFDAMKRKEVYGTSGTRPIVRLFGGWDMKKNLCNKKDGLAEADAIGVPMGSDMPPRPAQGQNKNKPPKPTLYVSATMDPGAGGLDRLQALKALVIQLFKGEISREEFKEQLMVIREIGRVGTPLQQVQIIKGWMDENGDTHEQVITVAGDKKKADVDPNTCETSGQGYTSLCTVWEDSDYDPETHQNVFYYARVLENPVCRWHTYTCNEAGVTEDVCAMAAEDPEVAATIPDGLLKCCPYFYEVKPFAGDDPQPCEEGGPENCLVEIDLPRTIQERAWTSPINIDLDNGD